MPSVLIYHCIDLNQQITDKIYRYRNNIIWDISKQQFSTETRLFPHIFLWKFVNIVLVLGVGIPTCVTVLLDALFHPENYRFFALFFVLLELYFAVIILTFFRLVSTEFVGFATYVNELIQFESEILKNLSKRIGKKRGKQNVLALLSHIRLESGHIDMIGIAMILLSVSLAFIPIPFATTALYLNLDAPYFFFKLVAPVDSRLLVIEILIFLVRITVALLCVIEGCTVFRMLPIIGILLFDIFRTCLSVLKTQNVDVCSLRKWREFLILFKLGNEYGSTMLTVVLCSLFHLMVLCYTVAILTPGRVPWGIYMFIPTYCIIISVIIAIVFYLLVNLSEDSKRIKIHWRKCCAVLAREDIRTARMLGKHVKCMQNIGFSYSSLGTVTKETRTDYIYSVICYTSNAVLAIRGEF